MGDSVEEPAQSDQQSGGVEAPASAMTPAQRLAYLEDCFILLLTFVCVWTKGKSRQMEAERDELATQVSVIISQQQFRGPDETY